MSIEKGAMLPEQTANQPGESECLVLALATSMQGSLRTKTVRAFTEDELRKITAVLQEVDRTTTFISPQPNRAI